MKALGTIALVMSICSVNAWAQSDKIKSIRLNATLIEEETQGPVYSKILSSATRDFFVEGQSYTYESLTDGMEYCRINAEDSFPKSLRMKSPNFAPYNKGSKLNIIPAGKYTYSSEDTDSVYMTLDNARVRTTIAVNCGRWEKNWGTRSIPVSAQLLKKHFGSTINVLQGE